MLLKPKSVADVFKHVVENSSEMCVTVFADSSYITNKPFKILIKVKL